MLPSHSLFIVLYTLLFCTESSAILRCVLWLFISISHLVELDCQLLSPNNILKNSKKNLYKFTQNHRKNSGSRRNLEFSRDHNTSRAFFLSLHSRAPIKRLRLRILSFYTHLSSLLLIIVVPREVYLFFNT